MSLLSLIAQAWTARGAMRDLTRYQRLAQRPRETQHDWLLAQIRREQDTAFGRDHHFHEIRTLADFRRNLPISRYEHIEPYIERVKQGETDALFHKQRVLMFALTSGTTSARKFIPVTPRVLDDYRRMWTAWGFLAYSAHPGLFGHARLTIVSDWDEFRTPSGVPCGSISGFMSQLQSWIVRRGYVLPSASGKLAHSREKHYLAWRIGMNRTIGAWVSPNPSTLLNLARFGTQHAETLLRDLHNGTVSPDFALTDAVLEAVRKELAPQPQRARALSRILERTGGLRPRDVWPELQLLGCWTGGSMRAYLRSFPEYFGAASVRDLGLIASEGRMTIPIGDGTPSGVLEIVTGFFEFVPVAEIDSPTPTVLEAHELQEGGEYFILLTTASGLYRYNIWDVVRCTGWYERTPLLEFLHKGSSIANVTGEKLTEHQASAAVAAVLAQRNWQFHTFSLAPCWDDDQPYYGLFVERSELPSERAEFIAALDRELQQANIEYAVKRDSQRLGPVRWQILPEGTWAGWDHERLLKSGGTAEQYKHPCLIPSLEFRDTMPVLEAGD